MLVLCTGQKGEPCHECIRSGPPGPSGIPGKAVH